MEGKRGVGGATVGGKNSGGAFTRQQLIDAELGQITSEVGSLGRTPDQTLSRVQELRDDGMISFEDDKGYYRLL